MMQSESRFVKANGLTFHVDLIGQGTPLVMIMGLGAPGEKWRPNYELYSKYFQCIVIDNRGAGQSDKPEVPAYSTDEMSDDVLAIMDVLGIASAHVIGVSMGGAIAQWVAIKQPKRVRSLILTSTFASVSATFASAITLLRDMKNVLDPAVLKRLNQWMTYGQLTQNHRPDELTRAAAEDVAYPYPMPAYAYQAQCNACLTHDTSAHLNEITAPTLVAAGAKDLFMNMEKTMELAHGIPHAELYLSPEGGHVHQWEYLDSFNSATLGFLLKHDVSPSCHV